MTGRVIVGLLWLTILMVVVGGWTAGGSRHAAHIAGPSGARTAPVRDDTRYSIALGEDAGSPPRVDLYGNEVEDAVSDYRIDPRGDIYERHSPETEVTQLAAPSM